MEEPSVQPADSVEFTHIPLDNDSPNIQKVKKTPRRIIHCSDGILEEYSTDEEEEEKETQQLVDPKTLTWMPWFWYYFVVTAAGALKVADTCGEKLAYFFGITSPKYQFAIDEYYRLKEEEEKENRKSDREKSQTLSSVEVEPTEHSPQKMKTYDSISPTEGKY